MAEAASNHITKGALHALFHDKERAEREFPVPVLQCLQIKPLGHQGEGTAEHYRVVWSDVDNFVQSKLATQANSVIHDGKLKKGSIVRLRQWQAHSIKEKKILIVLDLEVISSLGEPEKIGDPAALNPPTTKEEPANTAISGSGFYGNKAQQPPAQDRVLPSHSGPSSSAGHGTIYPIEGLTPYANRWTIKARVSSKSDIKTWHKATGEGKLFSVNFLDESGEIKATAFNDQCDMLYDVLQEGCVYYVSSCRVQLAKKQFSNLPNDYELTFERESRVEKAEDERDVPQVRFNFTPIADLQNVEKESTIDLLAVLREVGEIDQIKSKTTQKPYDKRDLVLVDESGYSIRMTIWGKAATTFNSMVGTVIAFKGAKVSDFGGRSLSLLSSGTMILSPDITESYMLKAWFDQDGVRAKFDTHANLASVGAAGGRQDERKTILQVKDDGLGMSDTPDYFVLPATITYIKRENFCYPACLSENCNKKVEDMGDGTWRCEKCQMNHDRPDYRYIMSLNVIDHTGQIWLSCFDDVGRTIMGMPANDLMSRKDYGTDASVFENVICRTYLFKCRAKLDTYQDQQNVRYQVMGVSTIDFKAEGNKLAELIQQYSLE